MTTRLQEILASTNRIGWVARLWSLLLFTFMVLRIVTPDPYVVNPVPLEDWFLLSLWGLSIFGLMLAWRWPRIGAWLAIALMVLRELAWIVLKGGWIVNFLIVWAAILPPAVLYLLANKRTAAPAATI